VTDRKKLFQAADGQTFERKWWIRWSGVLAAMVQHASRLEAAPKKK
jgi:hypothetical protein